MELSHALEVEAVVRTRRLRSSRMCLLLLWPTYALSRAAVHAYCCVVVRTRWSCCARLLLWSSHTLGGAAVHAYCCGHCMHSVELLCTPIVDD